MVLSKSFSFRSTMYSISLKFINWNLLKVVTWHIQYSEHTSQSIIQAFWRETFHAHGGRLDYAVLGWGLLLKLAPHLKARQVAAAAKLSPVLIGISFQTYKCRGLSSTSLYHTRGFQRCELMFSAFLRAYNWFDSVSPHSNNLFSWLKSMLLKY